MSPESSSVTACLCYSTELSSSLDLLCSLPPLFSFCLSCATAGWGGRLLSRFPKPYSLKKIHPKTRAKSFPKPFKSPQANISNCWEVCGEHGHLSCPHCQRKHGIKTKHQAQDRFFVDFILLIWIFLFLLYSLHVFNLRVPNLFMFFIKVPPSP